MVDTSFKVVTVKPCPLYKLIFTTLIKMVKIMLLGNIIDIHMEELDCSLLLCCLLPIKQGTIYCTLLGGIIGCSSGRAVLLSKTLTENRKSYFSKHPMVFWRLQEWFSPKIRHILSFRERSEKEEIRRATRRCEESENIWKKKQRGRERAASG